MTREDGESRLGTERAIPDSPLERLKGSVREYRAVGIEDWEALDLEDGTAMPGGSA